MNSRQTTVALFFMLFLSKTIHSFDANNSLHCNGGYESCDSYDDSIQSEDDEEVVNNVMKASFMKPSNYQDTNIDHLLGIMHNKGQQIMNLEPGIRNVIYNLITGGKDDVKVHNIIESYVSDKGFRTIKSAYERLLKTCSDAETSSASGKYAKLAKKQQKQNEKELKQVIKILSSCYNGLSSGIHHGAILNIEQNDNTLTIDCASGNGKSLTINGIMCIRIIIDLNSKKISKIEFKELKKLESELPGIRKQNSTRIKLANKEIHKIAQATNIYGSFKKLGAAWQNKNSDFRKANDAVTKIVMGVLIGAKDDTIKQIVKLQAIRHFYECLAYVNQRQGVSNSIVANIIQKIAYIQISMATKNQNSGSYELASDIQLHYNEICELIKQLSNNIGNQPVEIQNNQIDQLQQLNQIPQYTTQAQQQTSQMPYYTAQMQYGTQLPVQSVNTNIQSNLQYQQPTTTQQIPVEQQYNQMNRNYAPQQPYQAEQQQITGYDYQQNGIPECDSIDEDQISEYRDPTCASQSQQQTSQMPYYSTQLPVQSVNNNIRSNLQHQQPATTQQIPVEQQYNQMNRNYAPQQPYQAEQQQITGRFGTCGTIQQPTSNMQIQTSDAKNQFNSLPKEQQDLIMQQCLQAMMQLQLIKASQQYNPQQTAQNQQESAYF